MLSPWNEPDFKNWKNSLCAYNLHRRRFSCDLTKIDGGNHNVSDSALLSRSYEPWPTYQFETFKGGLISTSIFTLESRPILK